jgi:uncharacterized protein (UPF0333 family)
MNSKGQGALEYLLIIGGAIVVAVIAVSIIVSLSQRNSQNATEKNQEFETFIDNTIIPPVVLTVDCNKAASQVVVSINKSPTPGVTQYCLVYNNGTPTGCRALAAGNILTYSQAIADYNKQSISISADKNGIAYSQPSMPSIDCIPHN